MKLACICGCLSRWGIPPCAICDTGNYVDGWFSVERTAYLAVHVHAKFWQVAPNGAEPTIDHPKLIAMLRRRGYDGWISFEYEAAEAEATGIPRALAYLRRLLETDERGSRDGEPVQCAILAAFADYIKGCLPGYRASASLPGLELKIRVRAEPVRM